MFKPKTREELASLRAKRPKAEDGANKHRFEWIHARRVEDASVDAVCARCGAEEIDITPSQKKRTARWRRGGSAEILQAKPACVIRTSG